MGSMSFTQFLFSFEGRISRSAYWLKFYLPVMAIYVLFSFIGSTLAPATDAYNMPIEEPGVAYLAVVGLFALFALALLWPSLAVSAKRWHDRDKSGWWTLITFIPIIGGFWMLIECGFLKGTDGPNRFGADPLGGHRPAMEPQMHGLAGE